MTRAIGRFSASAKGPRRTKRCQIEFRLIQLIERGLRLTTSQILWREQPSVQRHIAGTAWSTKRYLNIDLLNPADEREQPSVQPGAKSFFRRLACRRAPVNDRELCQIQSCDLSMATTRSSGGILFWLDVRMK